MFEEINLYSDPKPISRTYEFDRNGITYIDYVNVMHTTMKNCNVQLCVRILIIMLNAVSVRILSRTFCRKLDVMTSV